MVPWNVVIWMGDRGHVMMLTIISNDSDWIDPWYKSYCWFKYLIFNERVIININFIFGRSDVFLSLWYVMTLILLHLPLSCWPDTASMTCFTVIDYFLPMTRIQTLVLCIKGKAWFHGMLSFEWEIEVMLWC